MERLKRQDLQDKQIQGPLDQVCRFAHVSSLGYRDEFSNVPLGKQGDFVGYSGAFWKLRTPASLKFGRLNSCFWELNIQLPHQFFDKEIGRSILKICFGSTT